MATLAVHQHPHFAGSVNAPARPQEEPTFLETTVRVSTVMTALYYASLATWAYPVLGMTCFITSAIVTYSKISGIPVQDLVDNICDRCIPVQPVQAQPMRRIVQPVFVPSSPGSIHGVLSIPITLQEVNGSSTSPLPDRRSPSPHAPGWTHSSVPTTAETGSRLASLSRGFVVVGELPDTDGYVPKSLLGSVCNGGKGK